MVGEILFGLFFLALGCLCLGPALRFLLISPGISRARREKSDKPKILVSAALGILFLLIGKGLFVMGLSAMF